MPVEVKSGASGSLHLMLATYPNCPEGPLGLSAAALAKAVGVTPARINEIVPGRRGITAETALRLARYFNTDARSWMNLQDRYELDIAARDKADALRAIRPHEVA